jgi:hypothetical protein
MKIVHLLLSALLLTGTYLCAQIAAQGLLPTVVLTTGRATMILRGKMRSHVRSNRQRSPACPIEC